MVPTKEYYPIEWIVEYIQTYGGWEEVVKEVLRLDEEVERSYSGSYRRYNSRCYLNRDVDGEGILLVNQRSSNSSSTSSSSRSPPLSPDETRAWTRARAAAEQTTFLPYSTTVPYSSSALPTQPGVISTLQPSPSASSSNSSSALPLQPGGISTPQPSPGASSSSRELRAAKRKRT